MTTKILYPGSGSLGFMNNNVERRTTTYSTTGISGTSMQTIVIPEDTDGNGFSKIINLTVHSRNDYRFDCDYLLQIYMNGTYYTLFDGLKIPWGASVPVITASNPFYLNGTQIFFTHRYDISPAHVSGATGGSGSGLTFDITVERYYDN